MPALAPSLDSDQAALYMDTDPQQVIDDFLASLSTDDLSDRSPETSLSSIRIGTISGDAAFIQYECSIEWCPVVEVSLDIAAVGTVTPAKMGSVSTPTDPEQIMDGFLERLSTGAFSKLCSRFLDIRYQSKLDCN